MVLGIKRGLEGDAPAPCTWGESILTASRATESPGQAAHGAAAGPRSSPSHPSASLFDLESIRAGKFEAIFSCLAEKGKGGRREREIPCG